jgi:ribose/xylose/arabinose/galactoside ABC-type transport system permease subunit
MTIYLGLAKLIGSSTMVRPLPAQIPEWMRELLSPRVQYEWMLFAPGVWLTLGLAVVVAAVLRYSVFGRHVFAVGSSEATARLCGINVPLTRIAVYTLAGLFVGVAGLFAFPSGHRPSQICSRLAATRPGSSARITSATATRTCRRCTASTSSWATCTT